MRENQRVRQIARLASFTHEILSKIRPQAESVAQRVEMACGFSVRTMLSAHLLFEDMQVKEAKDAYLYDGRFIRRRTHGVLVFDFEAEWVVADPTIAQFGSGREDTHLSLLTIEPAEDDFVNSMQKIFGQSTWERLLPFDPENRYVHQRFLPFYCSDIFSYAGYVRYFYNFKNE